MNRKTGKIRLAVRMVTALPLPIFLAGCNATHQPAETEPDYYYVNPQKTLSTIGKAVLVELKNNSTYPHIAADVTDALFQALQKKQVFSVTTVSQTDLQWRSLRIDPDFTRSFEQMTAIRRNLNCKALITGTITSYQPYPHLSIGLRLKMIDLADGQLLWAFEQVWDTTDKTTEKRIKEYFEEQLRSGITPLHEQLVVVSSLKFVKFVAYEVADTM
ncbi:MAG: hypothetical protein ACYS8Z_19815 [Planctomycetota bacterium]